MISAKRLRKIECREKQAFTSAAEAAASIASGRQAGVLKGELRPYICQWCSWWHYGHVRPAPRKAKQGVTG